MFQAGNTHILLLVFVFLCKVYFGFCILDSSKGRKSMVRLTNLCSSFLNLSWFFFIFHFYFFGDLHNVPFRYFVKVFGFFLDLVPCKKKYLCILSWNHHNYVRNFEKPPTPAPITNFLVNSYYDISENMRSG